MQCPRILTALALCAALAGAWPASAAPPAATPNGGDAVLVEMQQAWLRGDRAQLAQLLPAALGHPLEPWAAYWELNARLEDAQPQEVEAFLQRYAGSYQEDRMRRDWLLLLGQRRDWGRFAQLHPAYRMADDREVRCYTLLIAHLTGPDGADGQRAAAAAQEVRSNWYALRDADDGCTQAASELYSAGRLSAADIWHKARMALEANRPAALRAAVAIVAPQALAQADALLAAPARYLRSKNHVRGQTGQELLLLALIRLASGDPDAAAQQLQADTAAALTPEQRNWAWGAIGKAAALKLSDAAPGYFARATRAADLGDEQLAWMARAALRAGHWQAVLRALDAMGAGARADSAWAYWKARALLAEKPLDDARDQARQLFEAIAGTRDFYGQLALEELGQRVTTAPAPAPPSAQEKAAASANPGLRRALYAIGLGLRSEGAREWTYATSLHQSGGMADRELLAAADLACQRQVWDRCINTSERTRGLIDTGQRFPTPYRAAVLARARSMALEPAYVYGLMRQESRFIADARSRAGAAGLMQLMPATARWIAKKIGLTDFHPGQITDSATNINLGMAYLKLALDEFSGSLPLAAAAYNAGPARARAWRRAPALETAIWIENLPFSETRDYVKKVLANTSNYAAVLSGQPQSLKSWIGQLPPPDSPAPAGNRDLP